MRDIIRQWEKEAQALEPSTSERKGLRKQVIDYTEGFLENIGTDRAFTKDPEKGKNIIAAQLGTERQSIEEIVEKLASELDASGINPASGGHLGYIPGGGIYASSLADYWAAITNRYAGVFFANPGAVRLENKLLRWMADLVGYPEGAHGNLTSGGSVANMVSVIIAREAFGLKVRKIPDAAIYLTRQAHHSIAKAIKAAALEECHIRYIAMDDQYRMDPLSLRIAVEKDVEAGIRPFLLVGSAGTTDVGAIDPLNDLADISEKYGMWFHIDAAYGGFFILCDEKKDTFKGIERSDSLVIDPHKGLFIPYGLGACLVRKADNMKKAFSFQATYLQDIAAHQEEINPMDVSPEMTKHFRGLRLWLPLMLYGIGPFKACLEEKLLLARYFYFKIKKTAGFEVAEHPPELSVVTFRYVPDHGDASTFNKAMLDYVHEDGRVFFSSTSINGNFTLRLAILSFRTHLKTIDLAVEVIENAVFELNKKQ